MSAHPLEGRGPRGIEVAGAARAVVVAAWAGFFCWLWLSGQMARYLGPRTYWVVPLGAVALVAVAAGQSLSLRSRRAGGAAPARPSLGEAAGLLLMLVPIVAVVAVPTPRLGALAASRKATGEATLGSFAAPAPAPSGEVSFIDISFASSSAEYAARAGISEGTEVDLLGFVTDPRAPGGGVEVTRFYVSCCAADAIPYSVVVVTPSERRYPRDTWLTVSGELHRRGARWVVVSSQLARVSEPPDPYLY